MVLRPVEDRDTQPPPAPPTKAAYDAAFNAAIEETGHLELILLQKLELVRNYRDGLVRLRANMAVVSSFIAETMP